MKDSALNSRPLFKKDKPTLTFKVFFDADSGRCLHKTTGENIGALPFIVVDYDTYTKIDVCDNYRIANGQLEKVIKSITFKKLVKTDSGSFVTTKNNMIFIVNDPTTTPTDAWDYYKK